MIFKNITKSSFSPLRRLFSSKFKDLPFTNDYYLLNNKNHKIPLYQVMDHNSICKNQAVVDKYSSVSFEVLKKIIELSTFENIMNNCHRQGRISFFLKSAGEEATIIGAGAGLNINDYVYTQYREAGLFLWRGYTLKNMIDQIFGNIRDDLKGRQMPVHYGSPSINIFQASSVLATQIPNAVGSAYSFKINNTPNCIACFFGDGASNEGDALVSFNMANVLKCPVLFLCRNNQYAISTPLTKQVKVDGIADIAMGFGIDCIRVDGCDTFAVIDSIINAREYSIKNQKPVFLEFILYRHGDHTTSDDSLAYRESDTVKSMLKVFNPLERLRN